MGEIKYKNDNTSAQVLPGNLPLKQFLTNKSPIQASVFCSPPALTSLFQARAGLVVPRQQARHSHLIFLLPFLSHYDSCESYFSHAYAGCISFFSVLCFICWLVVALCGVSNSGSCVPTFLHYKEICQADYVQAYKHQKQHMTSIIINMHIHHTLSQSIFS